MNGIPTGDCECDIFRDRVTCSGFTEFAGKPQVQGFRLPHRLTPSRGVRRATDRDKSGRRQQDLKTALESRTGAESE